MKYMYMYSTGMTLGQRWVEKYIFQIIRMEQTFIISDTYYKEWG